MARSEDRRAIAGRTEDEGFLRRWSRRKAEARAADATEEQARPGGEAPPAEAQADPAAIDPADLPDIESLDATSDFKVFMRAGVPEHLRTQALRKLWRLNPALANLDGLVDYGRDYTDAAAVVPRLKTAYQVGRGIARKVEEVAEAAGAQPEHPAATPQVEAAAAPPAGAPDRPSPAQVASSPPPEPAPPERQGSKGVDPGGRGSRRSGPRPLPKRG